MVIEKQYDFAVTKDRLQRASPIKVLGLESRYYKINIYYQGDYQKDKDTGTIDKSLITFACRPVSGGLSIEYADGQCLIDMKDAMLITPEEAVAIREKLWIAQVSARKLEAIIKEYF